MHRRRRRRSRILGTRTRPTLYLPAKGDQEHLVCYIPPGELNPQGMTGVIAGPLNGWVVGRDYEFCSRMNEKTGFAVYSPCYDINSHWKPEENRGVPIPWIKSVYNYATRLNHKFVYLVGFSGGGAVACYGGLESRLESQSGKGFSKLSSNVLSSYPQDHP